MQNIKWLFFDIGSTLVDESKCIEKRCEIITTENGINKHEFYRKVLEYAKTDGHPVKPAARYYGAPIPPWNKELEVLYPHVESILAELHEKYKLGVIANQSLGTKERLDNWGISKYFDVIISSAEEGCEKPDLKIFELALKRANCKPEEAVMIGDRLDNDIFPANKIGMKTVWVRQGFAKYQKPENEYERPNYIVDAIDEIKELFILSRQEYCGDLINFKTYSKSFKDKRRRPNDKDNRVVFKDVNEPIIDRDTFETVQELTKKTKRRAPKTENGEKSIFCDLLYCADCGKKLWHHINPRNKDIKFFSCSNYKKDTRGTCESRHYVREDAIYQILTLELNRLADFLKSDEESFANILANKTNADIQAERKLTETLLQKAIARNEAVATLYEKLYEDNATGKVTDEWFMQLSHKYEVERMELKEKISEYRKKIADLGNMQQGKDHFIEAVRRFMTMEHLTAPLLRELIDRIEVYETEGTGKNRTQRIVIYYRFVGYIELPEVPDEKHYTADTRQGVAVSYLTKAS